MPWLVMTVACSLKAGRVNPLVTGSATAPRPSSGKDVRPPLSLGRQGNRGPERVSNHQLTILPQSSNK